MWWTGQWGRKAHGQVGDIKSLFHVTYLPTSLILPFIGRHGGHPVVGV